MKAVKPVALLSLITIVFSLLLAALPAAALEELPALETPLQGAMILAESMREGRYTVTARASKGFDFETMHRYLKMLYPENYGLSWTVLAGKAKIEVVFPNPAQVAEAGDAARALVAESLTEGMTVADKLRVLHDLVAGKSDYDYDAARNLSITGEEAFSAYGALVAGKAVCDGYTAAFSLLCHAAGIDNIAIVSTEMNHSWNVVLEGGQVRYVDVTFDDTGRLGAGEPDLSFFLVPEEILAATHTWDRSFAQGVIDTLWPAEYRAARALQEAGLFAGSDRGFELERTPMRFEAAIMLARLTGLEGQTGAHPFTDVAAGYSDAVGALFEAGLIKGVGDTQFAPDHPITAAQYLTLTLRALGYAEDTDFRYATAVADAVTLGILSQEEATGMEGRAFNRGDMALITQRLVQLIPAEENG